MVIAMRDLLRAIAVQVTDVAVVVDLEDGRVLHVPLEWFPRLLRAEPAQRANVRLAGRGIGIHWPDLDEDLSIAGLLRLDARPVPSIGKLANSKTRKRAPKKARQRCKS